MTLETPKTRICTRCTSELPKDAFAGDSRRCRRCVTAAELEAQGQKEKRRLDAVFAKVASSLRSKKIEVPHVCEIAAAAVKELGSPDELGKEIARCVKLMGAGDRAGTKTHLDALSVMLRLVEVSTKLRGTAPDVESLTDDEITKELGDLLLRRVADDPSIIAELARAHGIRIAQTNGHAIEHRAG
jgi:hypothetical protein